MAVFWNEKKARWYNEALKYSNFPLKILEIMVPLIKGCRTVLDIGAGCGALTIPLAREVEKVSALEPSADMMMMLKEEANRNCLKNIVYIIGAWGEVEVERHDVVLCANVPGLFKDSSPLLSRIGDYSNRFIFLVGGAGLEEDKFFFKELYPKIFKKEYGRRSDYLVTYNILHSLGIYANIYIVQYDHDQQFKDLDEACQFWKEYLPLEGDDYDDLLKDFLTKRLERFGDRWVKRIRKKSAIIWWEK